MSPEDNKYLRACRTNGIIIDTNLLIVLLVGSYSPGLVHSCCSGFDVDTYIYLERLLAYTRSKIIVTPHILTEVSNLTIKKNVIKEPGFTVYIHKLIKRIAEAREEYSHKDKLVVNSKMLGDFGFTDLSIIDAAKKLNCAVMTSDGGLLRLLLSENCLVKNINSIRPLITDNNV